MRRPLVVLLWMLLALISPAARAQPIAPPRASSAEPGAAMRVYLVTIGQGDEVWERFGHNAIWIHDPERGTDLAYNWGLFDFRQPHFIERFLTGDTRYWMQGFDIGQTVSLYMQRDRSVWAQELRLTPAQRLALRSLVETNALPENRFYRYDYYRDNCSTRVRDVLDAVLGGLIRRRMDSVRTSTSYRWHTRRLLGYSVGIYTGIETGLGRTADRPLTAWEEEFLPVQLRDHLRRIMVPDATGHLASLVVSERKLFVAHRPAEPSEPPHWLPGYLLTGVTLAVVFLLLGRAAGRGSSGARLGLITAGTLWSALAGVCSLLLIIGWAFTRHFAMGQNETLLLCSPLSLVLAFVLPRLGRRRSGGGAWERLPWWVVSLAAMALVLGLVPALAQGNGEIIALAFPVHLGLAAALSLAARGVAQPG